MANAVDRKPSLKRLSIDPANGECIASARATWRISIHAGAVVFEDSRIKRPSRSVQDERPEPAPLVPQSLRLRIRVNTATRTSRHELA